MAKKNFSYPRSTAQRQKRLTGLRNLKMARSAHAYVRGNTTKFYEWLESSVSRNIPEGPMIWICGDCHLGNLGPIAGTHGEIDIQVRDLDQTVIGNPAHDLIRLGLSLAMAARGSDLPGITTAQMIEELTAGYTHALMRGKTVVTQWDGHPPAIKLILKRALQRKWRHLANERIDGTKPEIPLGQRFWPLLESERKSIEDLFQKDTTRELLTSLKHRKDGDAIEVLDAAYWVKGCSSLGRVRYAVLVGVGRAGKTDKGMSLVDIKQATLAAAPRAKDADMPHGYADRVVRGATMLAPLLGNRMLAETLDDKPVVVRELLPQDLKIEVDRLNPEAARATARYLAGVVGGAHARQLSPSERKKWAKTLRLNSSKTLDAPSWLWSSIVDLVSTHEAAYLEHCRRFAAGTM
jgi:uncharacterized protein (DUF2252 family)